MIIPVFVFKIICAFAFSYEPYWVASAGAAPERSVVLPSGPDALPVCPLTPEEYLGSSYCLEFAETLQEGEIIFHAIFDFIRPSSMPLMTQQVSCRAFCND